MARTVIKTSISIPRNVAYKVEDIARQTNQSFSKTLSDVLDLMLESVSEARGDSLLTPEQTAALTHALKDVSPNLLNIAILPDLVSKSTKDAELVELVKGMPIPARAALLIH